MDHKMTKLNVFDLDDTLLRIPTYTSKFHMEETFDNMKLNDPYDFYDHWCSLDRVLHNIQFIDPVLSDLKQGISEKSTMSVLITHRVESLRHNVMEILISNGIEFDDSYFLGRKSKKAEVVAKILKKHQSISHITIYEDSVAQILQYSQVFVENPEYHGKTFEFYIVDKSRVFKLTSLNLTDVRSIKLI
jgi:hypothetical protein